MELFPIEAKIIQPSQKNTGEKQLKALEAVRQGKNALPPAAVVNFGKDGAQGKNVDLSHFGAAYFDGGLELDQPGLSYLEILSQISLHPDCQYFLHLKHFISSEDGTAKIKIEINGEAFLIEVNAQNPKIDSLDITDYLKEGKNTIRIALEEGSSGSYALQGASIHGKNDFLL